MPPATLELLKRARLELLGAIQNTNFTTDFYKKIENLADEIEQLIIRNANRQSRPNSSETSQGPTVKS